MAHTHDAWVIGEHELPVDCAANIPDYAQENLRHGNVVVHDLVTDEWSVMSPAMFARWYEWADGE